MSVPKSLFAALTFLFLLASGCGPGVDKEVVARVDSVEIRFADLLRFKADMPALLLSEEEGVSELEDYLQSMIDMELLVLEARARQLDQEPEFLQAWKKERESKLTVEFLRREIQEKIDLPKEELRQRWEESKWSRLLKLSHIRVATEEEAWEVVRQLKQERPFGELARERSINQNTASQGGLLEPLFGRGNLEELGLTLDVAEVLFELEVGQVSEPLELLGGYEIFKVVDARPAPASYYLVFSQGAMLEAFQVQRKALLARLEAEFEVELDPNGMALLVEKGGGGDFSQLSEQESKTVLARFAGGQVTLGDFVAVYPQIRAFSSVETDSSGLTWSVHQYLLPEFLLRAAIERRKFADDQAMSAWLRTKERSLLIEALRRQAVEQQVDLSEEALRGYYEKHQERFMEDEYVQLLEILVDTREEAEELARRIRQGADMEELAVRHSIRKDIQKSRGRFHLHPYDRRRFGALFDAALAAQVGSVQGPMEISGEQRQTGYSVFKILAKMERRPKPFAQAERQIRYWWKQEEEARLFEELVRRLREESADRIILFEENLAAMHTKSSS